MIRFTKLLPSVLEREVYLAIVYAPNDAARPLICLRPPSVVVELKGTKVGSQNVENSCRMQRDVIMLVPRREKILAMHVEF